MHRSSEKSAELINVMAACQRRRAGLAPIARYGYEFIIRLQGRESGPVHPEMLADQLYGALLNSNGVVQRS